MYKSKTIDLTTARANLSELVEKAYLENKEFVISKRNIPLARIVRFSPITTKKVKKIDDKLFGLWKNKKGSALDVQKELRSKAWGN